MAQRLGIIIHGITGRMGYNQHLVRSIKAIRAANGVLLSNGDRVIPDPILVGRNREKVAAIAKACGIERVAGSIEEALRNSDAAGQRYRAWSCRDGVQPGCGAGECGGCQNRMRGRLHQ